MQEKQRKKCIRCQKFLYLNHFYISDSNRDGYTNICKDCKRQYSREYQRTHIEKQLEYQRRYRKHHPEKIREWERRGYRKRRKILQEKIKKLKIEFGGKCKICGYSKSLDALVFHHRNPKEKDFGLAVKNWRKYEDLVKEAKKCDLICANCHYILHHNQV